MRRSEIIARIQKHEQALREEGATGLLLYGSFVRGAASQASDIDVIVEYDAAKGFAPWGMGGIYGIIADELEREVDLTTLPGLHPRLRDRVLAEAVRIF